MTDPKAKAEKCLQSPTTTEQNSTSCDNSSAINPNASILSSQNDRQSSENNAASKTLEEEALPQEGTKKKIKKPKKKSDPSKGPSSNKESGEAASSIHLASLDQPTVPIYCKKCLGINIGKKGERSDAYVITCSKCGTHEVLLKPDGNGVVKISEPGSENLPQGDLLDAAMKSAEDKLFSALKLKDEEYPKADEKMSSRIHMFSQHLQYCSRECADLYPLIITLRSLQLKKTSSTPQQRKTIENEIKSRLDCLEEGIQEIEAFATRFLKPSPSTSGQQSMGTTAVGKKKKCQSAQSSASAGATSAEPKESTSQACSSLSPLSPTATSPSGAVSSPTAEENNAVSSKPTGGASAAAAASVSNSAATASSKTKPSLWYIEKVEQLNSRLEIMHAHLARYIMIQSALIQNKADEAIAKVQRNEMEGRQSLQNFTQGIVEQCQSTAQDSCQKNEMKRKQIKDKQRLLAEASLLAQHCRANGDEEGLRRIEELLQQLNFQN